MPKKKTVAVALKQKEDILAYLQEGETLINISKKDNTPSLSTMHKWCRDDEDYSRQVETARVQGAIFYVEKLIELTEQNVKPRTLCGLEKRYQPISGWLLNSYLSLVIGNI